MIANYLLSADAEILERYPDASPFFNDIKAETAASAFNNTSFSPEKRGAMIRAEYALALINDRKEIQNAVDAAKERGATVATGAEQIIDNWFIGHRTGLRSAYSAYIGSHSRVASPAITGPARFPVERNRKRCDAADNKLKAISEYRDKSKKQVLRALLPHGDGIEIRTDDPDASKKLQAKIRELETRRDCMKRSNAVIRKHLKKSGELSGAVREACIADLMTATGYTRKTVEQIITPSQGFGDIGYASYELSNLGAEIRRLKHRVADVESVQSLSINDEFSNGISVSISTDGKICIDFGDKPTDEVRQAIRYSHGYKWSRKRREWVRKLTTNAYNGYVREVRDFLAAI
ncbi:hypothetical protein [Gilvimarinus chinensis]|uniref:hypothetical protein n=1 Tax=Gilvimarinus chinensis TaxID=396005 RepID=UPI000379B07E|nr:hypothetical protein [Gilvimarinus chinensis]